MTNLSASTRAGLESVVPGGVATRAADRLRMAHDASHYLLHPGAVITPQDAGQVAALLAHSRRTGTALTFRSGGTSLSGQAVTDRLLVDVRRHFRDLTVLDDGRRVRVQPGVVLRQVNARLAPYGRKLGPDPASESACTVGGVVANNSSGMTCGTEFNTYRTLESLVLALPSGTVLDTGAPDADARLRAAEPALHAGLLRLRDRVRGNPDSVRRVRAQYAMKNTMGYGVNAFLDHDDPAGLLTRLVVGSEGTLAFVASATFRTVPVHRHAATGLLVFDSLGAAMAAMPALVAAGPAAIELLDAAALRVAQRDPKADATLRGLAVRGHAALLAEWQESDPQALADRVADAGTVLAGLPLSAPARLSGEPAARAALWHIRKGLYAAVAGARPSGTTALLEDIAVPVEALAGTCAALADLFDRHRYADSVIFGHAKDGNLHFMLNERFDGGEAPARYADFTEEMVDLVLGNGGTLKAEHGTGRVMAPYVRRQFGDELYEVMRELKTLCDPGGVLNPGVLLSGDPEIHMRHLKTVPTVEEEVDRCVECGYCEPVCPSRDLTTTPRQRIVLRREIAAAQAAGDAALVRELTDDYDYDAVQTCAVDGMCATACPVLINTGDLVKRLRAQDHGRTAGTAWRGAARRWGVTTRGMARGLDLAGALPPALPEAATRAARKVLGADRVPRWQRDLPRGGSPRRPHPAGDPDAVFVPSCLGTLFAPAQGGTGVAAALLTLAERAGVRLLVPDGIGDLCCGTPWSSKGLVEGYRAVRDGVPPVLRAASRDGALPVVSDAASCTEGFERLLDDAGDLRVVDAVAYTAGTLLPRLTVRRRIGSLALHPTCSSVRLGLDDALLTVARAVADEVVVPEGWQCCGFAGDRGLLHPELTASATRAEAAAVAARPFDGYASVNRTCEIGLARATGQPYRHLLELLAEVTA
ncbi:FAD-binding and (Fe-S)-binding domain-containing protein [Micromonospora sp. WMMD1076]|uniref:FAD-binding and (Fe-S)-binding domain-containing protein n=1 Tax=Micromonospora sp. WMMD1076 TaxID=3016103 RepID=UPI002499C565|nr:FAD-binding and (Fe-S)-binding domain-containing protein [Micromonospora sp. WMMD1076]WFF05395.1 FAD-binding and (Fe-S)-binding domain-containing protein [Micromonospora sp. WMMD1076]